MAMAKIDATVKNVVLTGRSLVLTPYRRRHVPKYHAWMQDAALLEATASERMSLEEEYENCASWATDPHKLTFIVLAGQGVSTAEDEQAAMAGDVNLFFDRQDPSTAEVEVMIAEPGHRRKGLAAEALRLLLWYGSAKCGVTRFFCKIGEANAASLQLFEGKLGFSRVAYAECFKEHELEYRVALSAGGADGAADAGGAGGTATPAELRGVAPYIEEVPPAPASSSSSSSSSSPSSSNLAPSAPKVHISHMSGSAGDGLTSFPFVAQLTRFGGGAGASSDKGGLLVTLAPPPSAMQQQAQQQQQQQRQMLELPPAPPPDGMSDGAAGAAAAGPPLPTTTTTTTTTTTMGTLSVAMENRFEPMPHASTLLAGGGIAGGGGGGGSSGSDGDDLPRSVARFLVKLTKNPQVFVTSSLPEGAADFAMDIALAVAAHLKKH